MKDLFTIAGFVAVIIALLRQNRQLTAAAMAPTKEAAASTMKMVGLDDKVSRAWAKRRQNRNPGAEPGEDAEAAPIPIGM